MKNLEEVNKGIAWAEELLAGNLKRLGEEKTRKFAIKASTTASDYAYNAQVKKDKHGNRLTHDKRNFFEGVYMVFHDFVDKTRKR